MGASVRLAVGAEVGEAEGVEMPTWYVGRASGAKGAPWTAGHDVGLPGLINGASVGDLMGALLGEALCLSVVVLA